MANRFDIAGKVAAVTGASSGLGRHFALTLAGEGAKVALMARRMDRLEALAAEIARESAKTRKAFAVRMQQMVEILAGQFRGLTPRAARKQAMATLATMMGSLVMARVAGSGEFSDEILKSGRDAILERAKLPAPRKSAKRTAASA